MDLDLNTIVHRQKLFSSTLKSYFLRKITKYQNVLLKNGVHLSDQSYNCEDALAVPRSQSFEDHIELVIGQKSASPNACKTFWKIGNRISTIKLFRWIYLIVQRTKAARILHHLDGISDVEIETVIKSVGREIAVAFEYQICLLEGDLEIIKLAQHAGACIITYLNSKEAHYAPENLLQSILEVKPQSNSNKEILKTRTICFNNQPVCLRWRLSQVLKQPGLRTIPGDIESERSCPEKDKLPGFDAENKDEKMKCPPHNSTETEQSINSCTEQDKYKTFTSIIEDSAVTDNTENRNTGSGESMDGESETTFGLSSSADDSGSFIIVSESERIRKHRRISAVDMDFEKGVMKVTDYSVVASDFSPVGKDMSHFDDSDSTSIDEDLDSEGDNVETDMLDCTNSTSVCSLQENAKPIEKEGVDSQCDLREVREGEGTENVQKNGDRIDKKWDKHGDMACNKSDEIDNVSDTETCNKNGEKNSNKKLNEDGTACSGISTVNISYDFVDAQSNISNNTNLLVSQSLHVGQSTSTKQTGKPQQDLNDQNDVHASEVGKHIICDDHIKDNTYRSQKEPRNISEETVVSDCDESMPEFANIDKSYIFYGCFTPYGAKCRPKIYGYRGPLHVWNEIERRYTLIYNDTVTVTRKHQRQITKCSQDFHQLYIPKTVCRH